MLGLQLVVLTACGKRLFIIPQVQQSARLDPRPGPGLLRAAMLREDMLWPPSRSLPLADPVAAAEPRGFRATRGVGAPRPRASKWFVCGFLRAAIGPLLVTGALLGFSRAGSANSPAAQLRVSAPPLPLRPQSAAGRRSTPQAKQSLRAKPVRLQKCCSKSQNHFFLPFTAT